MLQQFQIAQDDKLKVQHEKECLALEEKVELSKKELDKEVHTIACVVEVRSNWTVSSGRLFSCVTLHTCTCSTGSL